MGKNENFYTVYYLCLIGWTRILSKEELEEFQEVIKRSDKSGGEFQETDGDWTKIGLGFENDNICSSVLGFYHSRIIITLKLKNTPNTVTKIRTIRIQLEEKIKDFFLKEKFIQKIEEINNRSNDSAGNRPNDSGAIKGEASDNRTVRPIIFVYPIFELNKCENFWTSKRKIPYSLPTTCFFTKLGDKYWKNVEMRISGAKIITKKMSDWFFETLVNIIFHEGLYPQSRNKDIKLRENDIKVYGNLENRLEEFASKLMTNFHQYSSNRYNRSLQIIALIATIIGLLLATIFPLINLWIQAQGSP